ncbi:unnamed protein product [Rotaria sp. Silwood2]|nr:unnamed protein product [Rotaria sp. Silwood2]CAF2755215.1 unnamed protein product [Rotaria sp. Silwood2]CAF3458741.1 unnamed protein product [Rotaria sp. Silwood2]CAF4032481.1 unnamed protein product [Rotaria sp. Silwood2]CAF4075850.1 unnamed protein product [Rotaria sp. Silwood2]
MFSAQRIKLVWILQDQHYMSTLLHSSLKHFQISPNEKSKAISLVKQELLKRAPPQSVDVASADSKPVVENSSVTFETTKLATSNGLLTLCFDQPKVISKPVLTPLNELDNYMALDTQFHENGDILLFWKENAELFPILSSIVRDLFSIPASDTGVERLFSSSKSTVTDRRTSLAAKKLNKLLFLQKNLLSLQRMNGVASIKLKEQPK